MAVPSENYWYNFACTPVGTVINTDQPPNDFSRVLVMDIPHQAILPGWGYSFPCTLGASSPCASASHLPNKVFGGGTNGYISKLFTEDAPGMGAALKWLEWGVAASPAASSTKFYIDPDAEDGFFPTDFLIGLQVIVEDVSAGTTETATITDNDNNSITVSGALTMGAPAAGDRLLISPMACALLWQETRTRFPASYKLLELDVYSNQHTEQEFTAHIYDADGTDNVIDLDAAADTVVFDEGDLERGQGSIGLPPAPSKSSELALTFYPTGGGTFHINRAKAILSAHPGEKGR